MAAKSYPIIYQDLTPAKPNVAILMGLHNGARFLPDQLESLARQSHRNWHLIVADDDSTDAGPDLIADFARTARTTVLPGSGQGFARTFLKLVALIPADAQYAAFCDQDDVWAPGKLARALRHLGALPQRRPALYSGRTLLINEELSPIGHSPLFRRSPCFGNALVQSIAGGNTMVMNRAAIDLLQVAATYPGPVPSHDWWAYQWISGCGGRVLYDPCPQVLYRQHGANLVGANCGWAARVQRLKRLFAGQLAEWNAQNIAALGHAHHLLAPDAQATLDAFKRLRTDTPVRRVRGLAALRLYRQTPLGTGALWLANGFGQL